MSNHALLNNITHKDVRIITDQHPIYGDTASYTTVTLDELRDAQGDYALFFRKNTESGQFEIISLFGFDQQENLYLSDAGWQASYIPWSIQRRPFLIGFQEQNNQGVLTDEPVVFIDMDSPRISTELGEPVFLPQGGQSDYLQKISTILQAIHQGHQKTEQFISTLIEHNLIESVTIKVELNNGQHHQLGHLYAIHEENVANLSDEIVAQLHHSGYLLAIHLMMASMSNMSKLIDKKNQQNES